MWHFFAAPTMLALVVVTLIIIFVCISKTNLSCNTKSAGLEGNHHRLVQEIIELVSL